MNRGESLAAQDISKMAWVDRHSVLHRCRALSSLLWPEHQAAVLPNAWAENARACPCILQAELKLWDNHTKDGFVAGSEFTLAGAWAEHLISHPAVPRLPPADSAHYTIPQHPHSTCEGQMHISSIAGLFASLSGPDLKLVCGLQTRLPAPLC